MELCRSFRKTRHSRDHSVRIPPFEHFQQKFNFQMQVQSFRIWANFPAWAESFLAKFLLKKFTTHAASGDYFLRVHEISRFTGRLGGLHCSQPCTSLSLVLQCFRTNSELFVIITEINRVEVSMTKFHEIELDLFDLIFLNQEKNNTKAVLIVQLKCEIRNF